MGVFTSRRINGGLAIMPKESNTTPNCSTRLTPSSFWRIKEAKALEDYKLYVKFNDDLEGFVDLSLLVNSTHAGVFAALQDLRTFESLYIECGAVTWPGYLDLAPYAMYDEIKKNGIWVLK